MPDCSKMSKELHAMVMALAEADETATFEKVAGQIMEDLPGIERADISNAVEQVELAKREGQEVKIEKASTRVKKEALVDSRTRKKIEKLNKEIMTGDFDEQTRKSKKVYDQTIEALKKEEARFKKQRDSLRRIKELRELLRTGKGLTPRKRKEVSDELAALKVTEHDIRMQVKRADEIRSLKEMYEALQRGEEVSRKKTRKEVVKSKELKALEEERDLMRFRVDEWIGKRPYGLTAMVLREPFQLIRSIITAYDVSATGRQGFKLTLNHPLEFTKAYAKQIVSFFSEKNYAKWENALENSPNAELYRIAKIDFTKAGGKLTTREENNQSLIGSYIPGVKASARAYSTYLNHLRKSAADYMISQYDGTPSTDQLLKIGEVVNVLTGRGKGPFSSSKGASAVFFAPVLYASELKYLTMSPLWSHKVPKVIKGEGRVGELDPVTRNYFLKTYIKHVGLTFTLLGLATLSGFRTEWDRRSKRYLHMELWPGFWVDMSFAHAKWIHLFYAYSPFVRQVKNADGTIEDLNKWTWDDKVSRTVRGKFSPQARAVLDVYSGFNYDGSPLTLGSFAWDRIPISASTLMEEGERSGIPRGLVAMWLDANGIPTSAEHRPRGGKGFKMDLKDFDF